MQRVDIGFTGTQDGMTVKQRRKVDDLLQSWFQQGAEFHHGDCIGADSEAHDLALDIGYLLYGHPPINPTKRAFKKCTYRYQPEDYLVRNKRIVTTTDRLIAAPKEMKEVIRSGTWSTVRFARKLKHPVMLVLPDGTLVA